LLQKRIVRTIFDICVFMYYSAYV